MWSGSDWIFQCDNVLSHTALSICKVLAKNSLTVVSFPSYSPELAVCDNFDPVYERWSEREIFNDISKVKQKSNLKPWTKIRMKSFQNVSSHGKKTIQTNALCQVENIFKKSRISSCKT